MYRITKTDFILFNQCAKSFWLSKRDPDAFPQAKFSDFAAKLAREGYEVEAQLQALVASWKHPRDYDFQAEFETASGLYARADMVRYKDDGTVDLYEVKSSTSVKTEASHNHIIDACFQVIAAEDTGLPVDRIIHVHLNGDYVRAGDIDPAALLVFEDITDRARAMQPQIKADIKAALALLNTPQIDRTSCTCLLKSRGQHCDTFDIFNPWMPSPSIYDLPRMHGKRLATLVSENRFALDQVTMDDVSDGQKPVLLSAHQGTPVIDRAALGNWFADITYPLYHLDYETYASAVPSMDGATPHGQLPVQFSLHIQSPGQVDLHAEYLADTMAPPLDLIKALRRNIGDEGTIIVWNKGFENGQNAKMAAMYPEHAGFLNGLISRTVDLQDVYKTGYIDIGFRGSTSIKAVLPVVANDIGYTSLMIQDGTAAMNGFQQMISMPPGIDRDALRAGLLEYCKLDTYAMVRLLEFAQTKV